MSEPWQGHVFGGRVISPPLKMIYLPGTMPPKPRIVYAVREWHYGETGVIDDPETWKQGVTNVYTSALYPFTEAGWQFCQVMVDDYAALKVRLEREAPKFLKKAAKGLQISMELR